MSARADNTKQEQRETILGLDNDIQPGRRIATALMFAAFIGSYACMFALASFLPNPGQPIVHIVPVQVILGIWALDLCIFGLARRVCITPCAALMHTKAGISTEAVARQMREKAERDAAYLRGEVV